MSGRQRSDSKIPTENPQATPAGTVRGRLYHSSFKEHLSRERSWSRGLEVTGGGTGIVSHAGLVLLRQLSDRTGLSDFRVMGDQRELFGPVASVPTAWRALSETARGGDRRRRRITAAVNKARRHAWKQGIARHGELSPVRVADRKLQGVTCIRLDATVVAAHSDKELGRS
jgi:hypothetical protein